MSISYTYMQAIGIGFPGVWCHSPDNGAIYESIVAEPGITLPTKSALDTWIVNQVKTDVWELIKAERDRRKNEGGYKVGIDWYHSDSSARIQQLGLVMMGAGLPANLYWKTMSNSFVLMTPTLALQIFQAAAASDMTIFTIAEQKKAAMLASATPGTYDYLSGWPVIYGE